MILGQIAYFLHECWVIFLELIHLIQIFIENIIYFIF